MQVEDVFGNLPNLETSRLLLRMVEIVDINDMFEYASDPKVTEHTSWDYHRSNEGTRWWIEHLLECYEKKQVTNWGIVTKDTQKFIGTCGFIWWNTEHSKAEVGYVLNPKFWGQGLMTEAMNVVIEFGFTRMQLNRIEASCKPANTGSWRVMEKIGMKSEGVQRQFIKLRDEYTDIQKYSILKSDYDQK